MKTDINTLLAALPVKIDDWLGEEPRTGRPPTKRSGCGSDPASGSRYPDATTWPAVT
ncbi:hypothetical protein ACFSKW_05515 [Nonomuraea mangrovi]|uniref:Uncharacterized protein n=1 Tax=Nonomuraea mangrovi TaxID=2316207 RepID=A0ABW4SMY5_9ACTN